MNDEYEADLNCFTVVSRGDIRKLPFNPLAADTVYGEPIAAGVGNAFDEVESMADFASPDSLSDLSNAEDYMLRLKMQLGERTAEGVFRKVLAMAKAAVEGAKE